MNANDYKREYNRMVNEINDMLDVLSQTDPESVALEKYRNYYQPITSDPPNFNTVRTMYSSAKKLIQSNQLSLESHERSIANAIDTLHKEGYGYINRRNFNSYMRFLDDARARGLGALYSSTQLIEAIHEAKNKRLSDADIKANIQRWSNAMKRDKEGRIIEQIEPKKLRVKV